MGRVTNRINNEFYISDNSKIIHDDNGYFGEAITKLATFENIYEDLLKSQIEISKELEKLRNEGKKNSVKFRELMIKKLNNSNVISIFKAYGVD